MGFEQFDEYQVSTVGDAGRRDLGVWDAEGSLAASHADPWAVAGVVVELARAMKLADFLGVEQFAKAVHDDSADVPHVDPRAQGHDAVGRIEGRRIDVYLEITYLQWTVPIAR